jgi:hypothetical protein
MYVSKFSINKLVTKNPAICKTVLTSKYPLDPFAKDLGKFVRTFSEKEAEP